MKDILLHLGVMAEGPSYWVPANECEDHPKGLF